MKFSLIICTYMRPIALTELLDSVKVQILYPDEIIIVDGSTNQETKQALANKDYPNLRYTQVNDEQRGLTKQRNVGIGLVSKDMEVVCFLDDDIILEKEYFKELIGTYQDYPDAIAVGGYITNEVSWAKSQLEESTNYFFMDGYKRKLGKRFSWRQKMGLFPNRPPCFLPKFGHGLSVSFLPPSNKTYKVEQFMGGVSSYKKEVFDQLQFSPYFEGYGLYEDADFCFRLLKYGKLYVNTAAKCEHHHHPSGRPNQFKYGKMMIRNGWYVWRLRWPNPGIKNVTKWYVINFLLVFIRLTNALNPKEFKKAGSEFIGRMLGILSLIFNHPKINHS